MARLRQAIIPEHTAAVRSWRDAHGYTQREAAHFVGVSERTWRGWERGERPVPGWFTRLLLPRQRRR